MPCSSERLTTTASGYSTTRPKSFDVILLAGQHLRAGVDDGAVSVGRLTTVARTCMAQSSQVATPDDHHHVVVDIGAGAVLGHHRDSRRACSAPACRRPRRPARDAAALNSVDRAREEIAACAAPCWERPSGPRTRCRAAVWRGGRVRAPPPASARRCGRSRCRIRSGPARRGRGAAPAPRGRAAPPRCRRPRPGA